MREDYYELLESPKDASAQDIKAAYRRLALRFHPDRNEGDEAAEERFKLVAEAYRTLGDAERRADYDAWLARALVARRLPPELASMPRHVHLSSRPRSERYEGRGRDARRPPRRVNTRMVFRRRSKLHTYVFIGMYAMLLFSLLPMFFRQCSPSSPARPKPAAGKPETGPAAWAGVLKMEQELRGRAAAGDAEAQYRLGFYLLNRSYLGQEAATSGLLRRAAAAGYLREAQEWLQRSAAQGNGKAVRLLRGLGGGK